MLAGIFGLTLFTVAVTIIRGTIQHGRIATDFTQSQNIAWVYFWISIEFITAYIIACLVSFRMLFVRNEKVASAKALANSPPEGRPSGSKEKSSRRKLLDSLLDTFHSWEGTTRHSNDNMWLNKTLPSGRMSVDFMQYQPGTGTYVNIAAGHGDVPGNSAGAWPLYNHETSRPESAKTLTAQEHEVHHNGLTKPESVRTVGNDSGSFERPSGW
jgi:hypothetical protein